MMEQYKLDVETSRALHKKHARLMELRQCYKNVSCILDHEFKKFTSGEWKIAYGYYTVTVDIPQLLARHCFILTNQNTVIDPTIMIHETDMNELASREYFVMKTFDDIKEYYGALVSEECYDLCHLLQKQDMDAFIWAGLNGYGIIG